MVLLENMNFTTFSSKTLLFQMALEYYLNGPYILRASYGFALQQKGCAMSTLGLSWKICESSLLPLGTQPQDFLRCEKAYNEYGHKNKKNRSRNGL